MATREQKVLQQIILHNKLLSKEQLAELFQRTTHPEGVIRLMATEGGLKAPKAKQLLALYRKRVSELQKNDMPEGLWDDDEDDEPTTTAATSAPSEAAVSAESATKTAPAQSQPAPPAQSPPTDEPKPAKATPKSPSGQPSVTHVATGAGKLVHDILQIARDKEASDAHITSGEPPVIRIAERLTTLEMPPIEAETCRAALLDILNDERRAHFEEHNDIDFCYDAGEVLGRFRTNFFVEQNGTNGVFRLINNEVRSLEDLGLPETVKRFTDFRVGIVLVTGPKSCGKTTTLAAMIDLINRKRKEHIITIEDPIEYVQPNKMSHISQREVGTHTKSFANALRAALREAPDVIMVGEMRDLETTSLAITAAETGHLVLATLHTPDAVRTIGRVLDVFPPKEQGQIRSMLSESLRGIVSQQLIPSRDGRHLELASEILVNTPAIGNMIREDRTFQIRGVMQTGRKLGMALLDESMLELVRRGKVNAKDIIPRAADDGYVRKELSDMGAMPQ